MNSIVRLEFVLVVFAVLMGVGVLNAYLHERALSKARRVYQRTLEALSRQPGCTDLQLEALDAGRTCAALERKQRGLTAYDDVSINQDIQVARQTTRNLGASSTAAVVDM